MVQLEENQHNTLDQQKENQHNTLDQQENNQSHADVLEKFMPKPLEEFLDGFLTTIALSIVLCSILAFLEWIFGIDTDNIIFTKGVFVLCTLYMVSYCVIFGCLVLNMISRVIIRVFERFTSA